MYFILVCIILLVTYLYMRRSRLDFKGPPAWPIIGNMLDIQPKKIHLIFTAWTKQYGDVYKLNMFGEEVLVVSGIDNFTDMMVLRSGDFDGRPSLYELNTVLYRDHKSIAFSQTTKEWKVKRKLTHASLKMFATGLERIEQVSMVAITYMLDELAAMKNNPCDPKGIFYFMTMNIMASFLVGKTYERHSEYHKRFVAIEEVALDIFSKRMKGALMDAMPFLKYVTNIFEKEKRETELAVDNLIGLIQREAKTTEDCLVSKLMMSAENGEISSTDIPFIILDLVTAGSITTTSSMYIFFNIMIHQTTVQEKLHQEVKEVIGERQVALKDRDSLPYVMATLLELLRYSSILPNGVFHMTTRDTTIKGKHVPANTTIYFNHFSVNHDESNFPEPFTFRPERFLDEAGCLVDADHPNRRNMNAFGAGTRGCVGESLAKARVFLAIVGIIQRFRIEGDDTLPLVTCDPRLFEYSMVLSNAPYRARFIEWGSS